MGSYTKVPEPVLPLVDAPVHAMHGERPRWEGDFWECCGSCDDRGWRTCCLVQWCPCVAWGRNVQRALGKVCHTRVKSQELAPSDTLPVKETCPFPLT